jgi:8-oxo-dGTP diphosphatase
MDGNDIIEWLNEGVDQWVSGQSVDCVILGYGNHTLYILAMKWKGIESWTLPGGFIFKDESMDQAATRVLKDRTGLDFPFLKQFHTFGNHDRRDEAQVDRELAVLGITNSKVVSWFKQRFITTGYIALVNIEDCELQQDPMSDDIAWHPVENLPSMLFDHKEIIDTALQQIKIQINYLPVGLSLLPEKFTMKDFQKLYECISQVELDRANFQKKILKLGITERLEKQMGGGAHKAPYLYKFDEQKYQELLDKGIGFMS